MEITTPVIIAIVLGGAFIVFVIYAIIKGQRRKVSAGIEEMIGKKAVARTILNPRGTVLAEGELWTAVAEDSTIQPGEEVVITRTEGLTLWVSAKSKQKEAS